MVKKIRIWIWISDANNPGVPEEHLSICNYDSKIDSSPIMYYFNLFNIGSDFPILVQIKNRHFHNTELESNLKSIFLDPQRFLSDGNFSLIQPQYLNFSPIPAWNDLIHYPPSRQLTVHCMHWQPMMLKFHKESNFHLPQSQNCLLGWLTTWQLLYLNPTQQTWSGFSLTTVPDNNRQSGFSPTTVPKLSTGYP